MTILSRESEKESRQQRYGPLAKSVAHVARLHTGGFNCTAYNALYAVNCTMNPSLKTLAHKNSNFRHLKMSQSIKVGSDTPS
jgi:hypothetical protein